MLSSRLTRSVHRLSVVFAAGGGGGLVSWWGRYWYMLVGGPLLISVGAGLCKSIARVCLIGSMADSRASVSSLDYYRPVSDGDMPFRLGRVLTLVVA